MTYRIARQVAIAALRADPHLRDNAVRDADQMVELATNFSRAQALAHSEVELTANQIAALRNLVQSRLRHTPIQHLRGTQEFYGRSFIVNPDVLVPRPETEHLVEEFLRLHPDRSAQLHIADVGTGSGILAVTLALEYPNAAVIALDISDAALAVAKRNAAELGAKSIRFQHSDLLDAVQCQPHFDAIVSNPPYIPLIEKDTLHSQVRDHEPHIALFSGDDGLDHMRRLIPQASAHLVSGGWLLLETAGRTPALDALLDHWSSIHYVQDLQGIERIAVARRS